MIVARERLQACAGVAAAAAALAVAHGSELFLHLIPCAFCLLERWPYRLALLVGLVALAMPRHRVRRLLWLMTLLFVAAAILSFVHVGVEQHWWPDPLPACGVPHFQGMSMAQRLAAMPLRPAKPCEDPDYLIPLIPVSMTQMGFAYALAISALLAIWISTTQGRRFR